MLSCDDHVFSTNDFGRIEEEKRVGYICVRRKSTMRSRPCFPGSSLVFYLSGFFFFCITKTLPPYYTLRSLRISFLHFEVPYIAEFSYTLHSSHRLKCYTIEHIMLPVVLVSFKRSARVNDPIYHWRRIIWFVVLDRFHRGSLENFSLERRASVIESILAWQISVAFRIINSVCRSASTFFCLTFGFATTSRIFLCP